MLRPLRAPPLVIYTHMRYVICTEAENVSILRALGSESHIIVTHKVTAMLHQSAMDDMWTKVSTNSAIQRSVRFGRDFCHLLLTLALYALGFIKKYLLRIWQA